MAAITGIVANRLRVPPRNRSGFGVAPLLACAWFVTLVGFAILADIIGLENYSTAVAEPRLAPGEGGTWATLLGTDNLGRSVLSRLVHGARISLSVGIGAAVLGAVIGTILGVIAVRFRRALEPIIDTFSDAVLALPPLIFMLALVSAMQPSVTTLVLGLTIWVIPSFARLVKANALGTSKRYFVLAAEALGASHFSVMFREILPNILGSILAFLVVVTANTIVAEGSLSFLGLGIPPPQPSWGGMIASGRSELVETPYVVLLPCLAIFLTVLSLRTIGSFLESVMDRREAKL